MNRRDVRSQPCATAGSRRSAFPSVSFAQVSQGAGSCSCSCAAASTVSPPSCRTATRTTARCAARSRSTQSELTPLDDTFGLAPGLSPLRALWDANELAVVHAMAIPHRTRSHFDGQAILETGLDRPVGSSDGWLNRLLQVMSGRRAGHRHRGRHAAVADRPLRGRELVAHAARCRRRCVPRAAGGAVPRRQRTARPLRGRPAAAGSRRRRADGAAATRGAAASRR